MAPSATSPAPSGTPERPRGRRAAGEGAREDIVAAARAEFTERGYDPASLRGVARRAGVDPGLVRYYFPGGKAELFAVALARRDVDPSSLLADALAEGLDAVGERLVRSLARVWDADDGPERFRAVIAAAATQGGDVIRDFLGREIFGRIAVELGTPDAGVRVGLAASQLAGLLVARHVLHVEPIASMTADELAATVGRAVQRSLTGEL